MDPCPGVVRVRIPYDVHPCSPEFGGGLLGVLIIDTVVVSAVDTSSFSALMISVARAEVTKTPPQTITRRVAKSRCSLGDTSLHFTKYCAQY
jgi:hypothetical protein